MGKKLIGRWMLQLHCGHCGEEIKRSIQDVVDLLTADKKAQKNCPHCGARITYEKGLTPQDLEEES